MDHGPWLKDALVFLAAAGLVVPFFHRARISAVLGFLLVGVAVGPYGFGQLAEDVPWVRYLTIEDRARVEPFAELGVLFLLFLVGLELSLARLWALRQYVAGIGALQFVVSALDDRGGPCPARDQWQQRGRARPLSGDVVDRDRDATARRAGALGYAGRPHRACRCCCFRT